MHFVQLPYLFLFCTFSYDDLFLKNITIDILPLVENCPSQLTVTCTSLEDREGSTSMTSLPSMSTLWLSTFYLTGSVVACFNMFRWYRCYSRKMFCCSCTSPKKSCNLLYYCRIFIFGLTLERFIAKTYKSISKTFYYSCLKWYNTVF